MKKGILVSGHWIVDISKRIDHWPAPGTLALIESVTPTNGGSPFNIALDLRRLDPALPISAIGVVGDDSQGDYVRDICAANQVECAGIRKAKGIPTSFTDVMTERETGRRTFFHAHGATLALTEEDFPVENYDAEFFTLAYLGMMPTLDAVGSDGRNATSRIFERASRHGMKTVADLVSSNNAQLAEQILPCLPHLDILFINEIEASRLLGKSLPEKMQLDFAAELAREVHALGVRGKVVLHYKEAAVSCDGASTVTLPCIDVPREEIVGATGAGDAFAAGYLLGEMHGKDTQGCLEMASCVAGISLRAITCSDAILPWSDCLDYGRKCGYMSL